MVLMSAGKAALNQASITNRPTCGGNKKAGLMTYSNLRGASSLVGKISCRGRTANCLHYPLNECPQSYREGGRNQLTSGGVGRTSVIASRGRGQFVLGSFR